MGTSLKLGSLASISAVEEEGRWIKILHPSGDPLYLGGQDKTPFRLRMAGSYSKVFRAEQKRHRDEAMKRRSQIEGEALDRRELSILAACTLEWDGAFDDDGKAIPFARENVKAIFEAAPFIADQADSAIVDHVPFFTKASPTP